MLLKLNNGSTMIDLNLVKKFNIWCRFQKRTSPNGDYSDSILVIEFSFDGDIFSKVTDIILNKEKTTPDRTICRLCYGEDIELRVLSDKIYKNVMSNYVRYKKDKEDNVITLVNFMLGLSGIMMSGGL